MDWSTKLYARAVTVAEVTICMSVFWRRDTKVTVGWAADSEIANTEKIKLAMNVFIACLAA